MKSINEWRGELVMAGSCDLDEAMEPVIRAIRLEAIGECINVGGGARSHVGLTAEELEGSNVVLSAIRSLYEKEKANK